MPAEPNNARQRSRPDSGDTPRPVRVVAATIGVLALLALVGAALFVYLGVYNVSALRQHTQPVYGLIDDSLRASIKRRANEIAVPALAERDWSGSGLRLYRQHCLQCHGAPGEAPQAFSLSLTPVPTALAEAARELSSGELFWVIQQGIKMSGMPAWQYRLSEAEIWDIVAFMRRVPGLSVADYRRLSASAGQQPAAAAPAATEPEAQGSAQRGREAIAQYGCVSCHSIPGITGASADVGPPLAGMASRSYIAGLLPNNRANMVRWLRFPHQVDPQSAMPPLDVNAKDAADMAAYLETLDAGR
tara:strand:- start:6680 stop:7588 length:909 start_codon:yes stop_codon:yes gene_type:complete